MSDYGIYVKPCPFCGNTGVEIQSDTEISGGFEGAGQYAVICSIHAGGCGASGVYDDEPENCAKQWNRRAAPAARPVMH